MTLLEPERVQIGVFEDETQPHRLTGQTGDVGSAFPGNDAVDAVTKNFGAVGE